MADPVLIEQVLMNLIKNGMEAMENQELEDPKVEIAVYLDSEHAKISVRDHGVGIPSTIRDKLFESFFTTKAEGMGMGLNICRSIIEYHHGQLWVEAPQTGMGSVFYFTLPLAQASSHPKPVLGNQA
jgi:signal transduction histidine kinase